MLWHLFGIQLAPHESELCYPLKLATHKGSSCVSVCEVL